MLLNSEELLALVNGDVEPDRLADLLDRLEHCSESAEALQVLVALRANRERALNALHDAQERELVASAATVTPHPATLPQRTNLSWASQGLRLAATVAIVAMISVWAAGSYFGVSPSVDVSGLAITEFSTTVLPGAPSEGVQLTASSLQDRIVEAHGALRAENFGEAIRLLEGQSADETGKVPLYLGMAYYFSGRYEQALVKFIEVRNSPTVDDTGVLHEAVWYEANALLKLDRPTLALGALEAVKSTEAYPRQQDAANTYWALRESLGMTGLNQD